MTVEELAKEDAEYWCSTPGSEGTKEELVSTGFMRGANTILNEVEYYLNKINFDEHDYEDLEDLYDNLCEMVKNIKETKGIKL